MKKVKTTKTSRAVVARYWPIVAAFVIGLGIGLAVKPPAAQPALASAAQKLSARQQITAQYLAASSTECSDPTDPIKPQDRVAVFDKYLQVNAYANRAVMRGCNNIDRLLTKNKQGKWVLTNVNMALDARANPVWQKACLIEDITVADTVVRPENSSIDASNLQECKTLRDL